MENMMIINTFIGKVLSEKRILMKFALSEWMKREYWLDFWDLQLSYLYR
ncbi:hypothetical protein [Anaerobium acetethylicum]|nr:hypothetical protein [Anaerobium acetethylicum]